MCLAKPFFFGLLTSSFWFYFLLTVHLVSKRYRWYTWDTLDGKRKKKNSPRLRVRLGIHGMGDDGVGLCILYILLWFGWLVGKESKVPKGVAVVVYSSIHVRHRIVTKTTLRIV